MAGGCHISRATRIIILALFAYLILMHALPGPGAVAALRNFQRSKHDEASPTKENSALEDEDLTCESGSYRGKMPPGNRRCDEPWYNATEHAESQKPGWEACHIIHGIFATAPFSLFFPLGALGPHIGFLASTKLEFHKNCMFIGQIMLVIGLAFGIWLSFLSEKPWTTAHQILGMIAFALVPVEFLLGYLHLRELAEHRTWMWLAHTWYGRVLIPLGIVNAGVGLTLAGNWVVSGFLAFIVCTVLFVGSYFTSQVWFSIQEARTNKSWKSFFFPGRPVRRGDGSTGASVRTSVLDPAVVEAAKELPTGPLKGLAEGLARERQERKTLNANDVQLAPSKTKSKISRPLTRDAGMQTEET